MSDYLLISFLFSHLSSRCFLVCRPSLCGLTHLGSPGHMIVEITATPDPWPLVRVTTSYLRGSALHLCLDRETPHYEPTAIVTTGNPLLQKSLSQVTDQTRTSRGLCVWAALLFCCSSLCVYLVPPGLISCFLHLHVIVCKLLSVNWVAPVHCSDGPVGLMIRLVRAFDFLFSMIFQIFFGIMFTVLISSELYW